MNLRRILCSAAAFACHAGADSAAARVRQEATVDSLVNAELANGVPGIAVAVVRTGTLVYSTTRGRARTSPELPVTDSTPFQIASTTKALSSTALLALVRDNKLRLDAQIGTLLPNLPAAWRAITTRQLLSHTSGLPDIVQATGTNTLVAEDWDAAFDIVSKRPLEFPAGSQWSYNQTNYALVVRLVESISHGRFEDYMQRQLFGPAEMRHAFFPSAPGAAGQCAENYDRGRAGALAVRDLSFPPFVHAAAGLCVSLRDFVQFDHAINSGLVLPPALLQELWTPAPLDGGRVAAYGLGWVVDATAGHRFVGHSGGNATAYRRYLDDSLTVIVLTNGRFDPDKFANEIATVFLTATGPVSASAVERLWDAARDGDLPGVTAALDDGADVDALDQRRSRSGRRALNWAALADHADVIAVLLQHGAQVDGVNTTGFTALHHAAEAGALQAARALLAAGASRTLKTADGERPIDVARRKGHADIAALIDGTR